MAGLEAFAMSYALWLDAHDYGRRMSNRIAMELERVEKERDDAELFLKLVVSIGHGGAVQISELALTAFDKKARLYRHDDRVSGIVSLKVAI